MTKSTAFIGLDTHKKAIAVAIAEGDRGGEVRYYGQIANEPAAVLKLVKKLAGNHDKLFFCYEAGPCGYGLQRQITGLGHDCVVIAPSHIPTKKGVHVKNDRRDALELARLHRAGDLTPIWVPDEPHEAMRDLVRSRIAAMETLKRHRQHLQGFLLRHGRVYPGKCHWNKTFIRWVREQKFDLPAHHILIEENLAAIRDSQERLERFEQQIMHLLPSWSLAPVVQAIQAMRGVGQIAAVILVSEIGDFNRFAHPRQLVSYLGLSPSEHSSGSRVIRGPITKAGSKHARRVLIEAAWSYRLPARVGRYLGFRQSGLPKEILDTAWKGQVRLCQRFRSMAGRRKHHNIVVTAVAREIACFMWAIARMVAISGSRYAPQTP
ncbi:MAG TPA: IS110 family transposase [Gemmataceae bacterium]|nr:IS110 family transposase [Gemmataceae bacterium]